MVPRYNHDYSRLKYQTQKLYSWTQKSAKERGLTRNRPLFQKHYKDTETFEYLNLHSCHSLGAKKGFVRINSLRLKKRRCRDEIFKKCFSEFDFTMRERSLQNLQGIRLSLDQKKFPRLTVTLTSIAGCYFEITMILTSISEVIRWTIKL